MGSNPVNLVLRFILEIAALTLFGIWGYRQSDQWFRFVFAVAVPVILAAAWGVFAVPGDPSRSGKAPIVTPGILRLLLELAYFGFATWCLKEIGYNKMSIMYGVMIVIHYVISYDRIKWLLKR